MLSEHVSLGEAKRWLRERLDKGALCPCCTQNARVYKRQIHSAMALALIALYRVNRAQDWAHTKEFAEKHPGDFAKLSYWGLIEEKPKAVDDDKKNSGYWRTTPKGRLFVERSIRVPKIVFVYDSRALRFEGPDVSIDDCLGKKFSYHELMS